MKTNKYIYFTILSIMLIFLPVLAYATGDPDEVTGRLYIEPGVENYLYIEEYHTFRSTKMSLSGRCTGTKNRIDCAYG